MPWGRNLALIVTALLTGCFASHELPTDAAVVDAGPMGLCRCEECGCLVDGCRFDDQVCDPFTLQCETVCETASDCFPVLDQVCEDNRCRVPPCTSDADCEPSPGLTIGCVDRGFRPLCTAVCVDDADCSALGARAVCADGLCRPEGCRSDEECVARHDERFRCRAL
ncbi:MAG: hypothetical protein AB8I08_17400 [Sandaracinaceae bacterium]